MGSQLGMPVYLELVEGLIDDRVLHAAVNTAARSNSALPHLLKQTHSGRGGHVQRFGATRHGDAC